MKVEEDEHQKNISFVIINVFVVVVVTLAKSILFGIMPP